MGKVKIGDLFELEKGSLQSSKCTEGEYDFITASKEWKTHNEYSHDAEALIFAAMASGSLGRTHYVNGKFISSDLCYILTPKDTKKYPINLKFYHFVFNSLRDEIVKNTKSGTSKESINQTNLKKYEIPYFDIKQQNLWIEKLINTKSAKESLEVEIQTQQALLKKLRQAILQEAIEGKLTSEWREKNPDIESASVLLEKIKAEKEQLVKAKKIKKQKPLPPISEDEIPFEIPDGWVWYRLNTLVSILGDGLHGTPHYKENQKCYFINGNNLSNGKIIFKDSTKTVSDIEYEKYKKPLTNRTILVSINGTLGNVAFYNNEYIILGKSACYFNLLSFIDKEYIKFIIESQYFLEYAVRMSSKTTINNLSLKNMNLLPIPLPPLAEQKEIVKNIENLFAICDKLEKEIESLKKSSEELIQAVLKEAFER